MFGSLIKQPLRIATRGAQITLQGAHEAIEVAEGLVGLVAGRLTGHNGHAAEEGTRRSPEPAAWRGPAASSTSAPADRAAPAPRRASPAGTTEGTSIPTPPSPPANGGRGTPPAPPAAAPGAVETMPPTGDIDRAAAEAAEAQLPAADAAHVDEEAELVEEVAEPGAEEGAGAQLRIGEPWAGYAAMKAADVIDRLATASPEELAAVELYEISGRNRKSIVAAAQRALKRASPPR